MDRRVFWTMVGVGVLLLVMSAELPARPRVVLLVVYGAVFYGIYWWQTRPEPRVTYTPPKDFAIPHEQEIREVEHLTIEEALRRAEEHLARSESWSPVEMTEEAYDKLKALTPTQQAFFRKHGGLASEFGKARIGAETIRRFKWPASTALPFSAGAQWTTGANNQPFTQIGVDFESNPILALRGEETVYIVHGTRSHADKWWCANYPSLYHWLLIAEIQLAH